MKAYHLKIALHGVSPMIWRRLVIAENTSLAKLHYVLQSVFDWDDEHLHRFHIYGVDYGINYVGAIMYSGDVTKYHYPSLNLTLAINSITNIISLNSGV